PGPHGPARGRGHGLVPTDGRQRGASGGRRRAAGRGGRRARRRRRPPRRHPHQVGRPLVPRPAPGHAVSDGDALGFETRAIHAGQAPDEATGAVVTPIYQTSTYAQDAVGVHRGFEYSRTANPTRSALQRCLASLEGAVNGFAFASGMAAEDAVLRLLPAGSHVVLPTDAYGGTYRLVSQVFGPAGLEFTPVDVDGSDAVAAAWRDSIRLPGGLVPDNRLIDSVYTHV